MNNQNVLRGLLICAVALAFGAGAFRYPVGHLSSPGAGLFPLLVSGILFAIGIFVLLRSRVVPPVHMNFNFKNIAIIMAALMSFALLSHFINMIVGIVVMVFLATLAGIDYSWKRNIKISVALVIIAFAFQKLLGLNLPLY